MTRPAMFPVISALKYFRCEMDPEHGRSWLFQEPNAASEGYGRFHGRIAARRATS